MATDDLEDHFIILREVYGLLTRNLLEIKLEKCCFLHASSYGLAAILMQKQEDGHFHPVMYFSKKTTQTESKYHSFELEMLAIVQAL